MSREPGGYSADLDQLRGLTDRMGACDAELGRLLEDLSGRMRALHTTWAGRAADAHVLAQHAWEQGFTEMQAALVAMRTVVDVAHDNYSSAAETNVSMWRPLA